MRYAPPAPRGRRLVILGFAVALHLAAAYALLRARGPERPLLSLSSVRAEILGPVRKNTVTFASGFSCLTRMA